MLKISELQTYVFLAKKTKKFGKCKFSLRLFLIARTSSDSPEDAAGLSYILCNIFFFR